MTATVPQSTDERAARRDTLVARARALGWSQNELARRAKKDPGHFSRVLAGKIVSAPAWNDAEKAVAREERRRSRRQAA